MNTPEPASPRVGLIIIGAQKAGTTSVWDLLAENHPQIATSGGRFLFREKGNPLVRKKGPKMRAKEVHFFDSVHAEEALQSNDFSIYNDLYSDDGRVGLDSTPMYALWPTAREAIFRYNPNAQIVLLVRDPIDRLFAAYRMVRRKRGIELSFLEFAMSMVLNSQPRAMHLRRGAYGEQVDHWSERFPLGKALHVIPFESLVDGSCVRLLNEGPLAALGMSPMAEIEQIPQSNSAEKREVPEEETVHLLRMVYAADVLRLEGLLGTSLKHWTSHPDFVE